MLNMKNKKKLYLYKTVIHKYMLLVAYNHQKTLKI